MIECFKHGMQKTIHLRADHSECEKCYAENIIKKIGETMLAVKKNGMIKGGEIYYAFNEVTSHIHVWGFLEISLGGIFKKKWKFNETQKVSKDDVLSANVEVGKTYKINGGYISITAIKAGIASAYVKTNDIYGDLLISLEDKYIDPINVDISARYLGAKARIEAQKV